MRKTFTIDCFPESARLYRTGYAVVAIDVIRATTTAITAAAAGWRCFPVPTLDAALELAGRLDNPLLCGELAGYMPDGFDLNNSPAELLERSDGGRPVIMLSSSGTRLIHEAARADALYLACFRNFEAVADLLASSHDRVALIGAGSRQEFREEDQMCCAWIGDLLIAAGYRPNDAETLEVVERWRGVPPDACVPFKSADYLRRSGQLRDLSFILSHVNDIENAFTVEDGEVLIAGELVRDAD